MSKTMAETYDEEKKDDVGNILEPQSASKRRARAAGSAGLSELSKQLRIFQAKNEAQAVDISRLERQLRILADLQGISVADLRAALEAACQNEAFGEMQSRVAKLRAELEAAMLAKQGELRKDMAAPEIANLQLRIGELEEVEEKQEREIHHLYEQLRHERARATRLESECDQHKKDINDYMDRLKAEVAKTSQMETEFQEKLRKMQEEYAKRMQEMHSAPSNGDTRSAASPEIALEYERLLQSMKDKDDALRLANDSLQSEKEKTRKLTKDLENHYRQNNVNSQVDNENMVLLIKQLQDADSQNELRLAQYKARFAVQDERITDMGQQLESLYAAFGLLKEERDSENITRDALRNSLDEADAIVARQMEIRQKKQLQKQLGSQSSSTPASAGASSTPESRTSPRTVVSEPMTPTARAVAGNMFHSPNRDQSNDPKERTATTWQLLFPKEQTSLMDTIYFEEPDNNGLLISGTLIAKSKSMVRKWKTKNSKLYLNGDHYRWDLGEGKSYALQFGISKVEFYPNHPLSFVLYTNPSDPRYPVVHAAACCEEDYHKWMAALTKATSGGDYIRSDSPSRLSFDYATAVTNSHLAAMD